MFSPSYRRSGPFPFTDLDMWDTKSHFTAQTSAWCGMAAVSGSGFLSKTTASADGFRPRDPGLRRWQSCSHLAPERAARSFSSSAAESRAGQVGRDFRQAEVVQWLHNAHEHLDTQLDRLRTRDMQLDYSSATENMFDMKQKLSKATSVLREDAAELLQFERSQHFEELREKALKLENDLLQMRATLNKGSNDPPTRLQTSSLLCRKLPENQEGLNSKETQKADSEMCKLREALREAEVRATTHEEERNKALQHLQTSAETQRTMLNQIEEMNKRLKQSAQNHSDIQEQLSEANSKISQACLDKAVLSTQVLKLEDNIKELKAKLTKVLSDKDHLMQEKKDLLQKILEMQPERTTHEPHGCLTNTESKNSQDKETVLLKEELKSLRQINEKLRGERESIKQSLKISQHQLHELKEERITNTKQIMDLEAQRSLLIREKEELLSKMNQSGHDMPTETKEKCCQHRESVEVLELERQKLQDQCLCFEAQVREKEEVLHLQKEEYQKQDAMKVQHIEELKSVVSHWTGKWQKVALSLQSTQEELKELKKNASINKTDPDSLLWAELDACKKELEQERSRSQALLQRWEDKGGEAVQTVDRDTETVTSESMHESPLDSQSHRNNPPQVLIQSHEVERLRQRLAEREKELSEKEHTLKSLERLRQMEKTEAQIKISALELKLMKKVSEDCHDDGGLQTEVSLRTQLDESKRRAEQLQQEKIQATQRLQTQRQQLSPVKDEKPSVEGRKDKTFCAVNPETEQQRRMVTEQLKSLFKEREGKETGKDASTPAAAEVGSSSVQNQTPTSLLARTTVDRRNWQQGSGLTPLFEEDEENSSWTGEEEEDPAE